MTLDATTWRLVATAIENADDGPPWLREYTLLTLEEVYALPGLDHADVGELVRPNCSASLLDGSYLDFLREQIQLGARGAEWNDILRSRLVALRPYIGSNLLLAVLGCGKERVALQIDITSEKLLWLELTTWM